jgi:calcineurin-like phosphoesterase family protein
MLKTLKLKGDESKIFFSGCLHIFHKQPFIWQKRGYSSPEEHAWKVLEKINETVGGDDTLFLLGDTFLNVPIINDAKDWLNRINCQNLIILYGNHNAGISQLCKEQWDYYNNGTEYYPVVVASFNKKVYGHYLEVEINDKLCALSHFPLAIWNKSHHGSWNVHSHNHGTFNESLPTDLTCKRLDCGWDVFARPVSFKEIREIMSKKKIAILDHHNNQTT